MLKPEEFIKKWSHSTLTERSAAQSHCIDLCRVLGVASPTEADQRLVRHRPTRLARRADSHHLTTLAA